MKKTLLIGAAIAVGFSSFAQNSRQALYSKSLTSNKSLTAVDHEPLFPTGGTNRPAGFGAHKSSAICTPAWISSAPNVLTVGGGVTTYQQGCLSYNKDLNSYVWTHRRSAAWAAANPMGSGSIQQTWWDAITGVKDSTIVYYEASATNPGRYPTGSFYNPAGNMTWSNVWTVGSGPDLVGNSAFTGAWYASRQLTGTAADQAMPGTDLNFVAAPNSVLGSSIFENVDMQQVGTRVLVGGGSADTTTSTNANFNTSNGGIIGHADFTGGGAPVWGHDSIIPGYYFDATASGLGYGGQGSSRIAFLGQTGYWVDFGRLATNFGNSADSTLAPIVYKTTNGGATWTFQSAISAGYDWRCAHPELMRNVGLLTAATEYHYMWSFKHGIDVTVDNAGKLHLVATMVNQVGDGAHPDSNAVYSLTYTHDYIYNHPIIWDLTTDGTSWSSMLIDSVLTSYVGSAPASDTTATFNPISDGAGGFYPYGARVQISRSDDGAKVFYSWSDTDTSVTGNHYNSQPDLFVKGLDVATGKLTSTINSSNGIATCFYHIMGDVSYYNSTSSKWNVPMVYTIPRTSPSPGVFTGTSVSDHFLVNCSPIGQTDFTVNAQTFSQQPFCTIGIQSHNNFVSAVNAYPNPTNGSTKIVVSLNESKNISVNVTDALGNLVSSKKVNGNVGENTITFDGSSLTAGVYYYTVTAGYEQVTKKLIVQK